MPSCGLSSFRSPPVKRLWAWHYTSCYIPFQGGVLAARLIIVKPREHESANRPFPSSKTSTFKTRLIAKHFFVKMSFIFMRKKNHFHINGFTCSLALKQRLGETRKWLTTVAVINLVKIFSRLCQTIILLSGFWRYCITSTMFPVAARQLFLSLMKRFLTKRWETRTAKLIEFVETLCFSTSHLFNQLIYPFLVFSFSPSHNIELWAQLFDDRVIRASRGWKF